VHKEASTGVQDYFGVRVTGSWPGRTEGLNPNHTRKPKRGETNIWGERREFRGG